MGPAAALAAAVPPEDAAAWRGGGSVEQALEWAEVRAAANEALKTVLSAPFHVFWSYVLHDATLMPFVDSFLRFAPRRLRLSGDDGDGDGDDGDDDGDDGDDDAAATDADEAELRRRVLLVLLRVATPRPSADECTRLSGGRRLHTTTGCSTRRS